MMQMLSNKIERGISVFILTLYMLAFFVRAMMDIGEVSKGGVVTEWYFPFIMLAVLALPAYLGYDIGKRSQGKRDGIDHG